MSNNVLGVFLKTVNNDIYRFESEIKDQEILEEYSKELSHHWKILINIAHNLNKLEKADMYHHIKKEVSLLVSELERIKSVDKDIKETSKKILSDFERISFKGNSDELILNNIKKEEIILTQKRIINAVKENKDNLTTAIKHLKNINKISTIDIITKEIAMEYLELSTVPIRQVFLQIEALIKLKIKLDKEKESLNLAIENIEY